MILLKSTLVFVLATCFHFVIAFDLVRKDQDTPRQSRDLVYNSIVGGYGGQDFEHIASENAIVKSIEVHCGYTSGGNWAVRGITWGYTDGNRSPFYGEKTEEGKTYYVFRAGEKINYMTLRAGIRVDRLQFTTSKGTGTTVKACGDGGTDVTQQVGNGNLVGFRGRYGDDVDALGPVFER